MRLKIKYVIIMIREWTISYNRDLRIINIFKAKHKNVYFYGIFPLIWVWNGPRTA